MSGPATIRAAREGEGRATLVAERDGGVRATGTIEPTGSSTEPEAVALVITGRDGLDAEHDLRPLAEALCAEARRRHPGRTIVLGWDTMDVRGLRVLESLGFALAGRMPYFELGPGQVEYVSGYRDPTGSTLDLVFRG